MPPKLSATSAMGDPNNIIRVDLDAKMLSERNPDGTYKLSDEELMTILKQLRGNREIAGSANKRSSSPKTPKSEAKQASEDDFEA